MATTDAAAQGALDTRQRIYEYVARERAVPRDEVRTTIRRRPASTSKPSRSGLDRARGTEPLRPSELERHLTALERDGRVVVGDGVVRLAE